MTQRTYKFRAWNKLVKKLQRVSDIGWYRPETGKSGVSGVVVTLEGGRDQFVEIEHIDLTQFTGLHDAKGCEIYEGDIVTIEGSRWVVRWDNEDAGFWFFSLGEPQLFNGVLTGKLNIGMTCDEAEIIGNDYQTPDLLNPYPDTFTSEKDEETREQI